MRKEEDAIKKILDTLDTSKLHFAGVNYYNEKRIDQSQVETEIDYLRNLQSVENKVAQIIKLSSEFPTFDENDTYQCRAGANRSTVDIWRIYNNYFRPVSIFTIMRALYNLVIEGEDIVTMYCFDIKKQVFFISDFEEQSFEEMFILNELDVRFAEWRTIGL